ncbi:MAG: hypothetical protein M0Z66_12955 [Thermaerobacter sp.]|nr:hypothetical protein [Thermaerobacter sp.]
MTGTPLTDAVQAYRKSTLARLHVPAHGGGPGNPALDTLIPGLCTWDVTEQPELDDLSHPQGPIAKAQGAAATLYGAKAAHYLTGGATQGVQAAVLASLLHGGALLAARDSHRSLLGAALLADADVVLAAPDRDPLFDVSLGLSPQTVERAFAENPDIAAVLVPYPTYLGIATDLGGIVRVAHEHGALTIADAAHGAHFGWHPQLPTAPLAEGADLVIAGMHKSGGSLTQTALLLEGDGAADRHEEVNLALRLIGTSSPSYLLMVSLEQAVRVALEDSERLLAPALAAAREIRSAARVLTKRPQDPLRIALQFEGPAAAEEFCRSLALEGVRAEYLEEGLALFIVPFGTPPPLAPLARAAIDLARPAPAALQPPTQAVQRIALGRALRARRVRRRLADAEGCVAADVVSVVPPGIPALWPGEGITRQALEGVSRALEQGRRVMGIDQEWLWVVAE